MEFANNRADGMKKQSFLQGSKKLAKGKFTIFYKKKPRQIDYEGIWKYGRRQNYVRRHIKLLNTYTELKTWQDTQTANI